MDERHIEFVKSRRSLYDLQSHYYSDNIYKIKIWNEIEDAIGLPGSMTIVLSLFAVLLLINYSEAGPDGCPLASKIYGCSPKCQQNYDCSHGKKCCPNACNAKSCVDVAAYGGNNSGKDKNQSGGAGVYCGNQKCSPFEVCKQDPATKRMKCSRA